jgi:hypothetical protein
MHPQIPTIQMPSGVFKGEALSLFFPESWKTWIFTMLTSSEKALNANQV